MSVVGPSGSGKTTLLNIVSGIETHGSGTVDLVGNGGNDARVGYVFRTRGSCHGAPSWPNLGFVQHERPGWEERARHYLDLVGLSHCADRFPAQLSGGQQQRIGIARAFAVEPDVLLMDEPFSHLDAMTSRTLREHLERIWLESRRTVMFVTHDVTEAVQLSDRIVVLAPRRDGARSSTSTCPVPEGLPIRRWPSCRPRSWPVRGARGGGGMTSTIRSGPIDVHAHWLPEDLFGLPPGSPVPRSTDATASCTSGTCRCRSRPRQ